MFPLGNLSVDIVSVVPPDLTDATTTTMTAGPLPASFESSVILTATVAADVQATSGTPSGTVEFYDGTIDLGPGTLNYLGDQIVATLYTPPLTLGDHGFTAVYSGDDTFESSTGTLVVSVTAGNAGNLTLHGPTTSVSEGSGYTLTLPTSTASGGITQWVINWGDGSPPQVVNGDPYTYSTETYTYQAPGDYLIQAVATTADGHIYSATLNNDIATQTDTTFGTSGTIDAGQVRLQYGRATRRLDRRGHDRQRPEFARPL